MLKRAECEELQKTFSSNLLRRLLCTFSVNNITVTQCVAVRTHRYRPSQYNLLCTFSVHNITVTHNELLSEHTVTDRHNTTCYARSLCKTLP